MAVLGAQLVITLIMVSVIQKLHSIFSPAKWILCSTGLYRYLHPTNDELRAKAGVPRERPQKNGKGRHAANGHAMGDNINNQFHIPCNIDIDLEKVPVGPRDVMQLRYFTEYQWLIDFSIYAGIVYTLSECYHYYYPLKNEVNLSIIWCMLVVFFSLKLMSSLTVLYFQSDESIGERSLVIVACLLYLLIAMIVLIVDERILETGLEKAYSSFNQSASVFLTEQGLPSSGPVSKLIFKLFVAFGCGILGALFTFPGLRMAKMHWDSLKYCRDSKIKQLLLNISFITPFLLVILWIRPISRDYLTVRIFGGMDAPLLSSHVFDTSRLMLVLLVVFLRFALLPVYLQSYLNVAYEKITDLRKVAGRITNVQYQQKISSIFNYLCVVTLQFAAPLLLCLYITLLYKSLGGLSWSWLFNDPIPEIADNECAALPSTDQQESAAFMETDDVSVNEFDILESAKTMQNSWANLKNVFSVEVYRGFLGFAAWWSYFTLFATTSLGLVYQSYFNKT